MLHAGQGPHQGDITRWCPRPVILRFQENWCPRTELRANHTPQRVRGSDGEILATCALGLTSQGCHRAILATWYH